MPPKNRIHPVSAQLRANGFFITGAFILLLAIGLRFFNIDGFSFWDDELYSISTATQPQSWYNSIGVGKNLLDLQPRDSFWTWKLSDPHPPLYEMALSLWTAFFGVSELAARGLSAILGVMVVMSAFALPSTIPKRVHILYALLLTFSGPLLIYSQDTRNYMMGICIVAWMFTIALRQFSNDYSNIRAGRPTTLLLALAALLMVTHFYGVIMVFSFAAVMTLQARGLRNFLRASLFWFSTLTPLLIYLYFGWQGIANKMDAGPQKALSFAMTFKRNTVAFLHNFFPKFYSDTTEFWALLGFCILAASTFAIANKNEKTDLKFFIKIIFFIQAIFFLILIATTRRVEFFSARYLVFLIPGSLLIASLFTVLSRRMHWIGFALTAFLIAGGLQLWNLSPRPQNWGEWRGASELVAEKYQPSSIIVLGLAAPWMQEYYLYYLRKFISKEKLDEDVIGILQQSPINVHLSEKMKSKPEKIIIFSYINNHELISKYISNNWPCKIDQWHNKGNLRIGTMVCNH